MAHAVTTQVLVDGSSNTIIKVNIKGDNATATELVKVIIFNASAYATGSVDNKLMEIEYGLNGFSAELLWDATTDIPLISLEQDHPTKAEFWIEGGLVNNSAAGRTGDILITTTGLASSVKAGYMIFYIKERNVDHPR